MSLTAPEQSPGGDQDPQGTQPAAAAPVAAPPAPAAPPVAAGSAPWAADLNAVFTDEATRATADTFLREKVQPYITQLEQKASSNGDAQRLYDAFANDPYDAYVAITSELFGDDMGQQMLGQIQQGLEQSAPPADPGQQQAPSHDPQTQELLQWVEQQRLNEMYNDQMASLTQDPQYADIVPDALHTFVAAAGGDFDQAVAMYRSYAAEFGPPQVQVAETPPPETPPEAAPVLGSDTDAQPGSTPTEPRKESLDEAIEGFIREQRTNPAPPVGSV